MAKIKLTPWEWIFSIFIGVGVAIALISIIDALRRRTATKPPPVFYVKGLGKGVSGACVYPFGIFIAESHRYDPATLAHEMKHWEQSLREGNWTHNFRYRKEMNKNGYYNNKYEVEARAAEENIPDTIK